MISITLATAEGLRSVGSAADPLDGADTTTLVAASEGGFWALVRHREVFRIVRGEAQRVAELEGEIGWCLVEHAGVLFIGTDNAGLFALRAGELARVAGFDATPGRAEWCQPPGRRPATTWSLASDSDHVFVNVHVGGIARSSDRGASFAPTIEIDDDVHEVSVGSDRQLWAATGKRGLAVSSDAGASWTHYMEGLGAQRYLSCVAPTDEGALVVASTGYGTLDDTVYRWGGERFERCSVGLPAPLGGAMHARGLAANGRAAAVAAGGRLYLSKDAGRSWALAGEGLPEVRAVVIQS